MLRHRVGVRRPIGVVRRCRTRAARTVGRNSRCTLGDRTPRTGLAMRTDKLAVAYQAALHVAAILLRTRR
jgi:hypothetical protein